jgi:hypothetical protein
MGRQQKQPGGSGRPSGCTACCGRRPSCLMRRLRAVTAAERGVDCTPPLLDSFTTNAAALLLLQTATYTTTSTAVPITLLRLMPWCWC